MGLSPFCAAATHVTDVPASDERRAQSIGGMITDRDTCLSAILSTVISPHTTLILSRAPAVR
jgi:hypothetical protein